MPESSPIYIHGTCVAIDDAAVLLRGPSGSGKSDLALRLIDGGAKLVADDQVEILVEGTCLTATAPAPLNGMLEVRGLGPVTLGASKIAGRTPLRAIIDLVDRRDIERLPDQDICDLEGVQLPLFRVAPFERSAPAKVRLMLGLSRTRPVVALV
jgi:serine kinase of HPr protein (carbohydrate metabolism regulator)